MDLNFKEFGQGEPLIIMHGLMGMLDNWQGPAKYYAEHFHVFIVDARNHGHSPHVSEMNYHLMAEDLLHFVESQDLVNVNLLGHSMGGKTCMKFAQNEPDLINKLVVADIAPKSYPVHHQKILEGLGKLDFDTISSRSEVDEFLKAYIPEIGVRQFLMKSIFWVEKGKLALRFNLDAITRNIELMGEEVSDHVFNKETLFIRGANSNYIVDDDIPELKIAFPESTIETIEGAGHWLHAEKPNEFIEKTLSFLLT